MVKLFDIQNGKVIPSEHCYTLFSLKRIMEEYPEDESVKIFDLTGNLWFSGLKSTPVLTLKLHYLPKGIYVVKINRETFKIHKL